MIGYIDWLHVSHTRTITCTCTHAIHAQTHTHIYIYIYLWKWEREKTSGFHERTAWLTDSLTEWMIDWLSHWLTHPLTQSLTGSLAHSRTDSFTQSCAHPLSSSHCMNGCQRKKVWRPAPIYQAHFSERLLHHWMDNTWRAVSPNHSLFIENCILKSQLNNTCQAWKMLQNTAKRSSFRRWSMWHQQAMMRSSNQNVQGSCVCCISTILKFYDFFWQIWQKCTFLENPKPAW